MSDFDDILNQPVEQPEAPSEEKTPRKAEWWQIKADRQRQEAYATLNRIFTEFSEGRGDVQGYLDTHGRFDRYSARNALLIHDKCPGAKQIGNYRYWEKQVVEILKTEKNNPIIILEPGNTYRRKDGTMGQNYYAKEVYDISQTTARGQEQPKVALDERLLLKALIYKSPADIHVVGQLPDGRRGALYQPEQNTILVEKGMEAADIFRCVSQELAKAQLMAVNPEQSLTDCGNKAFCVSYMLCRKYRIDTRDSYDCSKLGGIFAGKEIDTIKADLGDMENAMSAINSRMAKALYQGKDKNQNSRTENER